MTPAAKNVIVFFSDQQRWDTSSLYGNPLNLTPHYDEMAVAGTHLFNCFTNQPVCGPARAILQTGLYATTNGCYRNEIPLRHGQPTLGSIFRDNGFRTGYVGKWHLASLDPVPAAERGGYDYWLASNKLEYTSDAYDTNVYDNDCNTVKLPGYRVDALTDAAIRFIDRQQKERFFLFLSFLEPHHQNHLDNYPGPRGEEADLTGRWMPADLQALGGTAAQHLPGYYSMVRRLDSALGRVRDALQSLDLQDDTILLYAADHGSHFQTRNDEYKRSCHDACTRIPGAFTGGCFDGGGRITELVGLVDIPPTLLQATGIDVPDYMEGESLVPLLSLGRPDWPKYLFIQMSESQVGRAVRTARWKYAARAPDVDGWAASGADTYVDDCLYDLHADPHELVNLRGLTSYDEVATHLRTLLKQRIRTVEGIDITIVPAPPRDPGQRAVTHWEGATGKRSL